MTTNRREFLKISGTGLLLGVAGMGMPTLLAGCGSSGSGSSGTYKIGVLAPHSGVFAGFGPGIEHGSAIAVDEVNAAGGIAGKKISVVLADDKSDATTGASQARRLLNDEKVDLLLGTVGSDETLAVIPLVGKASAPFFYPVDGDCRTCLPGSPTEVNPKVFGMGDTPFQRLGKFVPYLVQHKGKNWYMLGNDYVYPHAEIDAAKEYLQQAGGTVVAEQYTPLGTSDYAPIVRKIQDSKADVVCAVVPGTDGNAFMKQASLSGLKQQATITGPGTFAAEIYSGMGDYANGAIVSDRYSERLDNAENKAFVAAYRKAYGDKEIIGPTAVTCYGAIKLVAQAAAKAKSTTLDAIGKALSGLTMNLPMGQIQVMQDSHLMRQHEYVMEVGPGGYTILDDLGWIEPDGLAGCSVK